MAQVCECKEERIVRGHLGSWQHPCVHFLIFYDRELINIVQSGNMSLHNNSKFQVFKFHETIKEIYFQVALI